MLYDVIPCFVILSLLCYIQISLSDKKKPLLSLILINPKHLRRFAAGIRKVNKNINWVEDLDLGEGARETWKHLKKSLAQPLYRCHIIFTSPLSLIFL